MSDIFSSQKRSDIMSKISEKKNKTGDFSS